MRFISNYIAIPFQEKGRGLTGCDCWGLVHLIYREQFGILLPSYDEEYEDTNDIKTLSSLMTDGAKNWTSVERHQERAGDVILLRLKGLPIHVGIVIKPGLMLHIHEGINASIEDYRRRAWCHRIVGFYRHLADRKNTANALLGH